MHGAAEDEGEAMKCGAIDNPKIISLAGYLRVPRYGAVGLMECLTQWAGSYAPDGAVGKHSDEAISRGCRWQGHPAKLISGMLRAKGASGKGLLEEHPEFRLVIHGWSEHCETYIHKKLKRAGLRFWDGEVPLSRGVRPAKPSQAKPYSPYPQGGGLGGGDSGASSGT